MIALLQSTSLSGAWSVLVAAVVGQIVVGTLFLIGFVAIVRRFMDKEVPAQLASVNASLLAVHSDLEKLSEALIGMQRMVDRHDVRIEVLDEWRRSQSHGPRGGTHS